MSEERPEPGGSSEDELPQGRSTLEVVLDVVLGLAAVGLLAAIAFPTVLFVLLTPSPFAKVLVAATWIGGLILVLWVLLTRGWYAIFAAFLVVGLLFAAASVSNSIAPVSFGY